MSAQIEEEVKVTTNTEFTLKDGTILRGNVANTNSFDEAQPVENRKIVFYFGGNAELAYRRNFDRKLGMNPRLQEEYQQMIHLNYRGCGNSTGYSTSQARHINDAVEVISSVIENHGVDPSQILLIGQSIGGTMVPCIKEKLDAKYPDSENGPSVIVDKSGYTLRSFALTLVNFYTTKLPFIKHIVKATDRILIALTTVVLKSIGWDHNFSYERWNKLKGNKLAIATYKDSVFPSYSSMAFRNKIAEEDAGTEKTYRFVNGTHGTGIFNILPLRKEDGKWDIHDSEEPSDEWDYANHVEREESKFNYLNQNLYGFAGV